VTEQSDPADSSIDQAAVVPYCIRGGRTEFCLITSIRSARWGIPKGLIDSGETPEETALKEAVEEAGLAGQIVGEPIGEMIYRKWGRDLRVRVFLMKVTREEDDWDESDLRERRWVQATDALELVTSLELRAILQSALTRVETSRSNVDRRQTPPD
jgi:8-oxo-dGTP pyrophosphatase MutT (NUDIX family)